MVSAATTSLLVRAAKESEAALSAFIKEKVEAKICNKEVEPMRKKIKVEEQSQQFPHCTMELYCTKVQQEDLEKLRTQEEQRDLDEIWCTKESDVQVAISAFLKKKKQIEWAEVHKWFIWEENRNRCKM